MLNGNKFTEGISYLGISIELPAEPITRAPSTPDDGDQGNDNFDDGVESEYNVENAAILLFKGYSEDDAKFIGAYVMGSDEATDEPNGDNITTSFQRTIQVLNKPTFNTKDGKTEQLYGLALVNYRKEHFDIPSDIETTGTYGNLTVKSAYKVTDGTLSATPVETTIKRIKDGEDSATTFSEFRNFITNCKFVNTRTDKSLKSIFMTNAPLSDKKGTTSQPEGANIVTLATLIADFKSTELDAMQNPAGCIFVERAVAKVTCSSFPKTTILKHTITDLNSSNLSNEDIQLTVANVSWLIDNVEKNSYIIRNAKTEHPWWQYYSDNSAATTSKNRYRFVGNNNMADRITDLVNTNTNYDSNTALHEKLYRTYWCEDPNYDSEKGYYDLTVSTSDNAADFVGYSNNFVSATVNTKEVFASPAPLYPHENTFDIAHQNYQNTTRVVFKVQYSTTAKKVTVAENGTVTEGATLTGCNLYAIRGKLNTFYLQNDAQKLLKRAVLSNFDLKELINKYKKSTVTEDIDFDESSFEFSFGNQSGEDSENAIADGDYIISSLRFKTNFISSYLDNTKMTEINAALDNIKLDANKTYHIVPFTDNTCYYVVYIQHFGDTYCGLPEGWKGTSTDDVYHANEDSDKSNSMLYLGRYGMVRNNWYDIAVGKIGSLGKATVPSGNVPTSDDNKTEEWFLSARIHVLSWAKRTQKVDF